jgi:hypothetical protein
MAKCCRDERRRGSRSVAVVLLGALLPLAGCASDHPAPMNCGVDASARPLGLRTVPFVEWVGSLPKKTSKEFHDRGGMLGDDFHGVGSRFDDDVTLTGEHLHGFGPAVSNDCSTHGGDMADFFESQGDRLREDTHCFFARAWNSLKLVE